MPLHICAKCSHYRKPEEIVFFNPSELRNPSILEKKLKWDEEVRGRRLIEEQIYNTSDYFDHEPQYYAWCEAFTPFDPSLPNREAIEAIQNASEDGNIDALLEKIRGSVEHGHGLMDRANRGDQTAAEELVLARRANLNPTTGEVVPFYALCDRMNPKSQCLLFDSESEKVD